MIIVFIMLFSTLLIYYMVHIYNSKEYILQYNYCCIYVYIAFMFPRFISSYLYGNSPEEGMLLFIIMCMFCLLMSFIGFEFGKRNNNTNKKYFINKKSIIAWSYIYTFVAIYFYYKISRLGGEVAGSTWTGAATKYNFFARLLPLGFTISLYAYLKLKTKITLIPLVTAFLFYLDRIIIAGRRSVAIEVMMIILNLFFFLRGNTLPRWIVIACLPIFLIISSFIAEYRTIDIGGSGMRSVISGANISALSQASSINIPSKFLQSLTKPGAEIEAAAYTMATANSNINFDYGFFHWNNLVWLYVPAQLFGKHFKDSLIYNYTNNTYVKYGYERAFSTALTGICDSFCSFWFFGCMVFFIISYIMGRLYMKSIKGNDISALFYTLIFLSALHAIPHNTNLFFGRFIYIFVFMSPFLFTSFRKVKF